MAVILRYFTKFGSFCIKLYVNLIKVRPILSGTKCSAIVFCLFVTTLHYRRIRGDMRETYKIVTGKYETCVAPSLSKERTYITRGNDL